MHPKNTGNVGGETLIVKREDREKNSFRLNYINCVA